MEVIDIYKGNRQKTEFLRKEAECVKDSGVKWVAQMSNPIVEWSFSCGRCLDSKPEESNHGKAGMFNLR